MIVRLGSYHLRDSGDSKAVRSGITRALLDIESVASATVEFAAGPDDDDNLGITLLAADDAEAPANNVSDRLRARVRSAVLLAVAGAQLGEATGDTLAPGEPSGSPGRGSGFADAQGYLARPGKDVSWVATDLASAPSSEAAASAEMQSTPASRDPMLLARLLDLANPHGNSVTLAQVALRRFGSFASVLSAPARDLRAVPGFGIHSVAAIKLVHEAALRLARAGVMHRPVLDNWQRLLDYLAAQLGREKIEQFRVLFLDEQDRLLADEAQARGTVNHTPVYPREVVRRALELQAASVILVHNHPSGDPTPSRDDLAMTAQVGEAAAVLSIALRDHVIVGNGRWTSFRQEGLL